MSSCCECPICIRTFSSPICLSCCGNTVCQECLVKWEHSYCPLCRGSLPNQDEWVPNRALESLITDISVTAASVFLPAWSVQATSPTRYTEGNHSPLAVNFFGADACCQQLDPCDPIYSNPSDNIWPSLRHPNILQFYGIIETNPPTILHEHCKQGSLKDILHISHHTFEYVDIITILQGIIAGLEYLHSNCFIHNNLNSSNILLKDIQQHSLQCSSIKLSGFQTIQNSLLSKPVASSSTHQLVACTAPEILIQTQDSSSTGRQQMNSCSADIYSFGVVMWELFTGGKIPWDGMKDADIISSISRGERLQIGTDLNENIRNILERCLDDKVKVRPSASEIRLQLALLANNNNNTSTTTQSQSRSQSQMQSLTSVLQKVQLTNKLSMNAITEKQKQRVPFQNIPQAMEAIVSITMHCNNSTNNNNNSGSNNSKIDNIELAHAIHGVFQLLLQLQQQLSKENKMNNYSRDVCIAIITVLKLPMEEPVISQLCCRVLAHIISNDGTLAVLLVDHQAIPLIIESIHKWSNYSEVIEASIALLSHLCVQSDIAKTRVLASSGCETVMKAMELLEEFPYVAQQCCSFLSNVAYNSDDHILSRLLSCDWCDTILHVLQLHIENVTVVEQGIAALASLTEVTSTMGKLKIEKSNIVDVIMIVLQRYPTNEITTTHVMATATSLVSLNNTYKDKLDVIIRACAAAAAISMTTSKNLQEQIITSGLCEAVVNCLQHHNKHVEVAKQAISAIVAMASFKLPASKHVLFNANTCDIIPVVLHSHSKVRDVVIPGMWALELIGPNKPS
eukprot:gene7338-14982_t